MLVSSEDVGMKMLTKMAILLLCSMSVFATQAAARTEYKCYVELLGGKEIIYFVSVKTNQSKNLVSKLTGRKVSGNGYKAIAIYQVKECVIETESFSSEVAQALDRVTIR